MAMDEATINEIAEKVANGIRCCGCARPIDVAFDSETNHMTCRIGDPAGRNIRLASQPLIESNDVETETGRLVSIWVRQFGPIDRAWRRGGL